MRSNIEQNEDLKNFEESLMRERDRYIEALNKRKQDEEKELEDAISRL